MLIVSDVHGAFDALGRLATRGETVLVLGDLINLVDYRTNEGILADVVGRDVVESVVGLRSVDDSAANRMWAMRTAALGFDVRLAVGDAMRCEYERMRDAIDGLDAYVIPGNVDDPDLLRTHLPSSATWVDGDVIDFEGEARNGAIEGLHVFDPDRADEARGLARSRDPRIRVQPPGTDARIKRCQIGDCQGEA